MILNNIEVNILSTMSLLDAYDNKFPEGFLMENVIYCVHNNVNGKNYIGQAQNIRSRLMEHNNYAKGYNYRNPKCYIGNFIVITV